MYANNGIPVPGILGARLRVRARHCAHACSIHKQRRSATPHSYIEKMFVLYIAMGALLSLPLSSYSKASGTGVFVAIALFCVWTRNFYRMRTGQAPNDCTSGFMSVDRMHIVLGNIAPMPFPEGFQVQGIIPEKNFTCSGSIESWIFGASWSESYTFVELQIWRPDSENRSYTKVGSTAIDVEEEGQTDLYQYPLSSPLHFQAGDILGYYRHIRLIGAGNGQRLYTQVNGSASQFGLDDPQTFVTDLLVLISVTTGKVYCHNHCAVIVIIVMSCIFVLYITADVPGCECGFMSEERMRLLLGLDRVGGIADLSRRQQITPDIRFTCDGMITKWIIGADWNISESLYPEVQIWRSSGNDMYRKINGTLIEVETESENQIYEYDNFPPIPFQAGDILGVFIPPDVGSKLRLRAESGYGPTNYYIPTTHSDTVSPYDSIDLQQDTPQVSSSVYHPLVTVEIIGKHSPYIMM